MPKLARTWPGLRNRLRSVLNKDGEDAGEVGPRPREDVEQVAGDDVVHHHELSNGGLARLELVLRLVRLQIRRDAVDRRLEAGGKTQRRADLE
eukprot:4387874-Alexandrium_andersonii.AAC.1